VDAFFSGGGNVVDVIVDCGLLGMTDLGALKMRE